jgi:hypothetical protein
MSLQQDREELRQILKAKSVKTGKFTLASGKESDLYVDCRVTTLDSRGAVLVGRVLHELLRQEEAKLGLSIGSLGGLTMGADPITLAVAMSSSLAGDATPVQAFVVRKEAKGHGRFSHIERHFTLDRTWKGTDHAASLEPDDMRQLCSDVRNVDQALGYKLIEVLPVEQVQRDKLKWKGAAQ